ncbi:hypothetical protein FSP39_013035 [Pinctada imbricata]|uniref:Uncharacterized protein n=1 Tax=Pinctada imbricata TaxID=66713 RepID=A0AA88XLE7_PINIB|nr:hypothetical protein FSP39_013035 [Pinctada imbricata]
MTALAERKVAAVIGALVADAAAQPLHWNYKTDKLDAMLEGKEEVVFWEPSANPFYRIKTGKLSCYGDQSYVILKSLVDCNGLDMRDLNKRTFEMFGPDSDYEDKTNAVYKDKSDAEKKTYPIDAPWRNASIKNFIKQYQAGNEETGMKDEQMDGVLRLVSVVALYAGRPEMLEKVEDVVTSTQNSDTSLAVCLSAARILEYYILNGQCTDGVDQAINQLSDPKRNNPTDLDKAMAGKLRQVLVIPGAFQSAVHGVVTNTEYTTGVRTTIRAGGCNCSRGGFIGACLAAQYGVESIPEAWKEKTLLYKEISDLAQKLVGIQLGS